ncbi:hypothetical protein D3C73_1480640 [compost metagenome]
MRVEGERLGRLGQPIQHGEPGCSIDERLGIHHEAKELGVLLRETGKGAPHRA